MTLLRRFLVISALLFWQGGFLFYASVVVPVAQQELSHLRQGFVTRRVTNFLNLSGAVALAIVALELAAADRKVCRRVARALVWLGMAATLAVLVWLHIRLDALLDPEGLRVLDRAEFYPSHRAYLWVSTIQWALGVVFLWLTLAAWRAVDRSRVAINVKEEKNGFGKEEGA